MWVRRAPFWAGCLAQCVAIVFFLRGGPNVDDGSFFFEPELASGVFARAPRTELEHIAESVRRRVGSEVAAVLNLSSEWAKLAVQGSLIECAGDKEVVLMAWLQEADSIALRRTPPKLLLLFGCLEVLVVPIQSPARLLGVLAVSWPTEERRPLTELSSLAAELALELEAVDRRSLRQAESRHEARTEPAPAPFERVA